MRYLNALPAAIAAILAGALVFGVAACGKSNAPVDGAQSSAQAADAAASSAEAAASSAEASSALARASDPAAGTASLGENAKTNKPSVNVREEGEASGDEASQALRAKVDAAKAAGNAPTQADIKPPQ